MFLNLDFVVIMMMLIDSGELRRSEERAYQLGSAIGGGLLILVGIGFIIEHFVRRKR